MPYIPQAKDLWVLRHDNKILTEEEFHIAFPAFLQDLQIMSVMQPHMENIPVYNDKCKTSRIINIDVIIKKCI